MPYVASNIVPILDLFQTASWKVVQIWIKFKLKVFENGVHIFVTCLVFEEKCFLSSCLYLYFLWVWPPFLSTGTNSVITTNTKPNTRLIINITYIISAQMVIQSFFLENANSVCFVVNQSEMYVDLMLMLIRMPIEKIAQFSSFTFSWSMQMLQSV
jgi:hypothetical protein